MTVARWPLLLALIPAMPAAVGLGWSVWAAGGGLDDGFAAALLLARLADGAAWLSLGWSTAVAAAATVLATIAAMAVAVAFPGPSRLDRTARGIAALPLPVVPLVVALGAILLLGQSGLLARFAAAAGWITAPGEMPALLQDRYGVGLVLALAWKEFGFLALVACSIRQQVDPELLATARTLGASSRTTAHRVIVPLLWRGLAPSVVAVFLFVLGNYELAALLGPSYPHPIAVAIVERSRDAVSGAQGEAAAMAVIAALVAAAAVVVHERWRVA